MRMVTVSVEHRFSRTPDGKHWTEAAFAYSFWQRYLMTFDVVRPCARVKHVERPLEGWHRADGPGVVFVDLPYYEGPLQYLAVRRELRGSINNSMAYDGAVIMRLPSQLGTLAYRRLRQQRQPFGAEVVGDPFDVFAKGAVRHPLRAYFRFQFSRMLKMQCREAGAIAYVTGHALQQRYPPGELAFQTNYSSVELPNSAFAERREFAKEAPYNLLFIGSLSQPYKAADILIDAICLLVKKVSVHLTIIGDGRFRGQLEAQAARVGVSNMVTFAGQVPSGVAVRNAIDRADLFVLPSRTEGLPRAMIESMARGLPCVGSTSGGISELLEHRDMVPPNDATSLARLLESVLLSPARRRDMSVRGLAVARNYREDVLMRRRKEFYDCVLRQFQSWQAIRMGQ